MSRTVSFVLENTSPTVAACDALCDHVSGFLFSVAQACAFGWLGVVRDYFVGKGPPRHTTFLLKTAASRGQLEVVKYLFGVIDLAPSRKSFLLKAAGSRGGLKAAAGGGQMEVVRYLCAHREPCIRDVVAAWDHGHAGVAEYLLDSFWSREQLCPFRLKDLKWCLSTGCFPRFCPQSGVEVLPDTRYQLMTEVLRASVHGNLEAVAWLLRFRDRLTLYPREAWEARWRQAESASLVKAAEGGHLKVAKFFVAERRCRATPLALERAAERGHVATVAWLCNLRHFAVSSAAPAALDGAAAAGQVEVVKYLLESGTCRETSQCNDIAAEHGHREVVAYLGGRRQSKRTLFRA